MNKNCEKCLKSFDCYKSSRKYCSKECFISAMSDKILCKCEKCNKEIYKKPSEISKKKNLFCSQKCFHEFQNRNQKPCQICNTNLIKNTRSTCSSCYKEKIAQNQLDIENKTIKELQCGKGANQNNKIRYHALQIVKDRLKICVHCNYDFHVEVAHIKGISDFDETAKIREVNHPVNLLLLCPNCHYEFDHSIYKRKEILNKQNIALPDDLKEKLSKKPLDDKDRVFVQKTKIKWPSIEEMTRLINEKPMIEIGKILGVSSNSVKKYAMRHKIQRPESYHWHKNRTGV